jgi:ankyrin repeat protein
MLTQRQLNENLIKFAKIGDLNKIKLVLEQGADIHASNDEALRISAKNGHLEIVKYLVEHGANIHINDNAALRNSAIDYRIEVFKYLVEKGANIYIKNDIILKHNANIKNIAIVQYLIIDCNMKIKEETFQYLTKKNHIDIINLIHSRDLHNRLNKNLNNDIIKHKHKFNVK